MSTANTDDKSPPSDPAAAAPPPPSGHAGAGIPFEEYKKKLEERLAELGKQMETLKDLLSKAAHDAKHTLEQQLDKLQRDHAEEFERLGKLRAAGEAGLNTLGARLDKLVEDVTAAITAALGFAKPAETAASEPKVETPPATEAKKPAAEPVSTDAAKHYADAAHHAAPAAQPATGEHPADDVKTPTPDK